MELRDLDVLVLTDFSEGSARAVAAAVELVAAHGGRLTLLHVGELATLINAEMDPVGPGGRSWADIRADVRAAEKARLAKQLQDEVPPSIEKRALYLEGRPAHTVQEALQEHAYSMVVMGHRGRGKVGQLVMGSTASKLVRAATIPVLVVP